ncbi:MAG: redoxin domain-containing protein [Planctomycetota bacterium]|nr:redoxin domain-containing protein [Planctomycetota bacterium]MDA1211720.1 redoxin domain-containing protein [Planctomycetota bacterium]
MSLRLRRSPLTAIFPMMVVFNDQVVSNVDFDSNLSDLEFLTRDGSSQALRDFLKEKPVILVITRGYAGSICPFCSSQTSRLINNYQKFVDRGAEVVVVYPLEKPDDTPRLDEFLKSIEIRTNTPAQNPPFPLLLDVELKVVDQLGIRASLSRPATYILDRRGQVRFAYVGRSIADRPSVQALLDQLDQLKLEEQPTTSSAVDKAQPFTLPKNRATSRKTMPSYVPMRRKDT